MSNTRNTPIEVLEMELPLRIEEYALRSGSGGLADGRTGVPAHRRTDAALARSSACLPGGWPGGEGVVRQVRALEPCSLSLITERRRVAPKGAAGGGDALPGRNLVNGVEVGSTVAVELAAGDVVRIETPGGGGLGAG
jgi:N-methylhydantoinase B